MSSLLPPSFPLPAPAGAALAPPASAAGTMARVAVLATLAALVWDASGLDMAAMHLFGTPRGFALEHHWLLEKGLHTGVQRLCVLLYAVLWIGVFRPWTAATAAIPRRERLAVVLAVSAALLAVSGLKQVSLTSCPSQLQAFGGTAAYVSHWAWGVADGGPGRCFPGGHASSALAFVALALPWLDRADAVARQRGARLLTGVVAAGLLLGLVQSVRGHHHPSHTLWTLVVCLAVSAAVWALMVRRPGALPAQADVQRQVDGHASEDGAEHGLTPPLAPVEK